MTARPPGRPPAASAAAPGAGPSRSPRDGRGWSACRSRSGRLARTGGYVPVGVSEIGQPALRQLQEQDQAPARDLPVSSARSQPLVGRNFPVRQPVTDPEEQLAVWKAKCPELADRFEQLALELQSRQSDWDGAAFDKVCGRLFDQYLRSERS